MAKTKNSDNIKKLQGMRKRAQASNLFSVVAKLDIRLKACHKKKEGKNLKDWF